MNLRAIANKINPDKHENILVLPLEIKLPDTGDTKGFFDKSRHPKLNAKYCLKCVKVENGSAYFAIEMM